MPLCVAIERVTTSRGGVRTVVKPGEAFDFTDEEYAELKDREPPVVRKPIVELPPTPAVVQAQDAPPAPVDPPPPAPSGRRGTTTKEPDL